MDGRIRTWHTHTYTQWQRSEYGLLWYIVQKRRKGGNFLHEMESLPGLASNLGRNMSAKFEFRGKLSTLAKGRTLKTPSGDLRAKNEWQQLPSLSFSQGEVSEVISPWLCHPNQRPNWVVSRLLLTPSSHRARSAKEICSFSPAPRLAWGRSLCVPPPPPPR